MAVGDLDPDGRRYAPGLQETVLVVGSVAVGGWFLLDLVSGPVFGWRVAPFDWLTLVALVVCATAAAPTLRRPDRLWTRLATYPRRPLPVVGAVVTATLVVVGVVGPVVVPEPVVDLRATDQPPVGVGVPAAVAGDCVGRVVDGTCYGSLAHPLGTTRGSTDVFTWLVYGTRTAVQFAFTTVAIVAPVGVLAGVTAGYVGGRVDALVTASVDLQQTVPTVIVYFFVATATTPSLFVLVLAYGLFDWGSVARVVRTRTLDEREAAYVEAAESAGAGWLYTIRTHLLPNVAPAVVASVSLLLPRLILVEVALGFLGFGGEGTISWGQLLGRGVQYNVNTGRLDGNVRTLWWGIVSPALATLVAVTATSLVGDAFQSATDPTEE